MRRKENAEAVHAENPCSTLDHLDSGFLAWARSRIPFRLTLRARGGTGIFAWEVGAGRLPAGLRLRDDGSIAGTPQVAGTYRFIARARDTESRSIRYPVTLDVTRRLTVTTAQMPAGKLGRLYSANLATVGGVGPTRWKLVEGRLPSGIRLAAESGCLTGTPRETGSHVVRVEVRDRLNATSTRTLAVVIGAAVRSRGMRLRSGFSE